MSTTDDEAYRKAGLRPGSGMTDGLNPNGPLQISEKPHQHRAVADTPCHDCGNIISKGEAMVVSALECTQGMNGRSYRYNIHQNCYPVVGRLIMAVGKDKTHGFEGRKPLTDLWDEHRDTIRARDPELAKTLEGAFG